MNKLLVAALIVASLVGVMAADPVITNQTCNATNPNYVDLTKLPGGVNLTGFNSCSGFAQDNQTFYWFFANPNQALLAQPAPVLVWINNVSQSSLAPMFLEVGPLQFNYVDNSTSVRSSSWLNYMNLIFIDGPGFVGYSKISLPGNLQSTSAALATQIQWILAQYNLNNNPLAIYGREYGAQIALRVQQDLSKGATILPQLILDNPIVDIVNQKTSIGPGGLGIGLYSPEQTNIVQTKLSNCLLAAQNSSASPGTVCQQIGNYYSAETNLDSYDTRSYTQGGMQSQIAALNAWINNDVNILKFAEILLHIQTPTKATSPVFSVYNQSTFNYYQQFFANSTSQNYQFLNATLSKMANQTNASSAISIIVGEFNMQVSAIGTSKVVALLLGVDSNYRNFPIKQVYSASRLSGVYNGLHFGYFYQSQALNYFTISSGEYINTPQWLNASSELVQNLASGNNQKLCYQGQCSTVYGKCSLMNNCSGNGQCSKTQGFCTCNPGWGLEDCSQNISTVNISQPVNYTLQPRAWVLLSVEVTSQNTFFPLLRPFGPIQEVDVFISNGALIALDTFENFGGQQYQGFYKGAGNKYLSFSTNTTNYVAVRNPSFTQTVNFTFPYDVNPNKPPHPGPSTWAKPNAGYVFSIVFFSIGCAGMAGSLLLYFLKIRPMQG